LDVFAVHCVGGGLGILLVAMFGAAPIIAQFGSLIICLIWSLGVTYVIAKALNLVVPMRVSPEDEAQGLDIASHGEQAYDLTS
jgi:ammonium transporter, Amt family